MSADYISWEEAVLWLRSQPEQKELVYHCYYDDPIEKAAERYSESEEWHEILHLLQKNIPSSVLDIGAGRGISSYAFAKAGCMVTALEPDPSSLVGAQAIRELFSKTGLPVTIVEEKGENLPFSDASFDIVYGRAVFHHAADLRKFCAEAKRVIREGGTFLMTREHVISRREDLKTFLDGHPLHSLYGGENAYLIEEYLEAISFSGLRDLKIIGPFESVINYAPMTMNEFHQMIVQNYSGFLGKKFAERLASWQPFAERYGSRLSLNSDYPGRLYTFRATK